MNALSVDKSDGTIECAVVDLVEEGTTGFEFWQLVSLESVFEIFHKNHWFSRISSVIFTKFLNINNFSEIFQIKILTKLLIKT